MTTRTRLKAWGLCLNGRDRFIVAAATRKRAAVALSKVGITPYQFRTHGYQTEDVREVTRASMVPEVVLRRPVTAAFADEWTEVRQR